MCVCGVCVRCVVCVWCACGVRACVWCASVLAPQLAGAGCRRREGWRRAGLEAQCGCGGACGCGCTCDDEEGLLGLHKALEQGHDVVHVANLPVGDQDARPLELARLRLLVLYKVGRDVPSLDLHALGELDLVGERLAILHHGRAVGARPLEAVGDRTPHLLRARRDDRNVADFVVVGHRLRHGLRSERTSRVDATQDNMGQANRGPRAVA